VHSHAQSHGSLISPIRRTGTMRWTFRPKWLVLAGGWSPRTVVIRPAGTQRSCMRATRRQGLGKGCGAPLAGADAKQRGGMHGQSILRHRAFRAGRLKAPLLAPTTCIDELRQQYAYLRFVFKMRVLWQHCLNTGSTVCHTAFICGTVCGSSQSAHHNGWCKDS
jgi:hypothetical protein